METISVWIDAQPTKAVEPTASAMPLDLIEAGEAASMAMVHVSGIRRWVKDGKLRGWRRAGRVFVSQSELAAMFQPVLVKGN